MEIKIQTLTPLWTGGVDGSMDRIHETGIIGSMRWWYEAIVRGLGGSACDPSRHRCPDKDGNYCDVCRIFGATGWKRRFRVKIIDKSEKVFLGENVLIPSGHIHDNRYKKRAGGWYIVPGNLSISSPAKGEASLEFPTLTQDLKREVFLALMLIERWGGLGAKQHLGYGTVEFFEQTDGEWKPLKSVIQSNVSGKSYRGSLPALNNLFFAKVRFKTRDENWWNKFAEIESAFRRNVNGVRLINPITDPIVKDWLASGAFPIAPIIRNWLRFTLFSRESSNMLNYSLGTAREVCPYCFKDGLKQDRRNSNNKWCGKCRKSLSRESIIDRVASRVKTSSAYFIPDSDCWEFRIWGWFPENIPNGLLEEGTSTSMKRDMFIQTLYDAIKPNAIEAKDSLWNGPFSHLEPCHNVFQWREFAAPNRDTLHCKNPSEFLESLLGDSNHDL